MMRSLRNRKIGILGGLLVASIVLTASVAVPQAMSLGRLFFDTFDASCDLYYPYGPNSSAGPVNPSTTKAMCSKTYRPVVIWSGQSYAVKFPIDAGVNYSDSTGTYNSSGNYVLSKPTSKLRAVFKNLPDANNDGIVEKGSMALGDAVITIKGAHMCNGETNYAANRGDQINGEYYGDHPNAYANLPGGLNITQYDIGGVTRYGTIRNAAQYCSGGNADISVDLKTAAVQINPVQGVDNYWYVDFTTRHIDVTRRMGVGPGNPDDGIANKYQMVITSSSSKAVMMAPAGTTKLKDSEFKASDGEGYIATMNRAGNGAQWDWLDTSLPFDQNNYNDANLNQSHYASYVVRFGSDCTVTDNNEASPNANTRYRIMFYDIDRQVTLSQGTPWRAMRVTLHDVTPGKPDLWLWPQNTNEPTVSNWNFQPTPTSDTFPIANGDWQTTQPNYNQMIIPPNGTLQYFAVSFPAIKDRKYELVLSNVENNLVFQYGVPFDAIFYEKTCDLQNARVQTQNSWTDGSGNPATAIEGGQAVNFASSLQNVSSRVATVNDARVRVWKDEGSQTYGAGDVMIAGSPWDLINANTTINPGAVRALQSGSATGDVNYAFLCVEVYSVNGVTVGAIATNVDYAPPACVKIGKYPALRVLGGDVRSGGVYTNGVGNGCSLGINSQPVAYRIRAHAYGGTKGSMTENGVLTPGPIRQFGSGNLPYKYDPVTLNNDNSIKLLFGTDKWVTTFPYDSNAPNNESGYFLGLSPDASSPTQCLPDLATQYAADAPANTNVSSASLTALISPGASRTYTFTGNNQTLSLCGTLACPTNGTVTFASGQTTVIRIKQSATYDESLGKNKVVIKANIAYPNRATQTYSSPGQIPSFVLIADPGVIVSIDPSVTTINGIIGARDDVYTCGDYDGINNTTPVLTTTALSVCTPAFNFYGSIISSGSLYPFRTNGYDTAANNTPAETFTQLPETFISHYEHSRSLPVISTDLQTELPPRL